MEIIYTVDEIDNVVDTLIPFILDKKCVAFFADMGSGKTTLIRSICKKLNVVDNVSSPTFSIINEYAIHNSEKKVIHMDWYRLKNKDEAIDIGVLDYLNNTSHFVFIEWPQIAQDLLPTNYLGISIDLHKDNSREISIK
jgi:tRNA threonylcarbamoyladenosine biosynthesis protein TsaE